MEFGFLKNKRRFVSQNIEIRSLWDIDQKICWFNKNARLSRGWYYPPMKIADQNFYEKKHNKSCEIQSEWHILPATHTITLHPYDDEKVKFLLLGVSFVMGLYLSPAGFYCLGKIPYDQGKLTGVIPIKNDVEISLDTLSKFYDASSPKKRKNCFAILHWFLAGQNYEFQWDRFDSQYKVLDGIFKTSEVSNNLRSRRIPHAERPVLLADHFSIDIPPWAKTNGKGSQLSKLRNDLVHEAVYAGQPIGYGYPDNNYDLEFRRFNTKLIAALLGLKSNFLKSPYNDRQRHGWGFV